MNNKHEMAIREPVQPEVQQRLTDLGAEPVGSTSAEFANFLKSETAKWSKVIKDAHIKAD